MNMKEIRNLHLRVQEMCDCYAGTDLLEEMSKMTEEDKDLQESAVKWLALAVLHGINSNAKKISIERDRDGRVEVIAKYRPAALPAPSKDIADAVMAAMREITHIEEKGKLPLSMGIRDSSIDLNVKLKTDENKNKLKIEFKC